MRSVFQQWTSGIALILLVVFSIAPVSAGPILGNNLSTFAILGGAGVSINGTGSVITGSIGGCCGATAVTGVSPTNFTDSGGTVFNTGTLPAAIETNAQADLGTAITALNGLAGSAVAESTLNGITLAPGVYSIGALTLTGTLTLNGEGNSNAMWVFLESSTFMTAGGSHVDLINDGSGAGVGVYWVMTTSANLGVTSGVSTFEGNILANGTITVGNGVTGSCGSLATQVDSVTLASSDTLGVGCQGGGTLTSGTITPLASSAVPEPGTLFLLVPGLALLLIANTRSATRKRRAKSAG
jgi:hypothetical protein